MKATLLIFVVYVHTYYGAVQAYNFGDIHEHVNIVEVLQKKCESNAGNTQAYYNLEEGIEVLPNCVRNAFKEELPEPLEQHEHFCRILRKSEMYACVLNLTDALRPCLYETEAYLPNLLLTMLNTTYDELCGVSGLSNLESLYRISDTVVPGVNITCLRTTGDFFNNIQIYSNSVVYRNLRESSIVDLNAKDVCSDLKSIHNHITLVMKQNCNEDYSRFMDIHLQPFLDDCNAIIN